MYTAQNWGKAIFCEHCLNPVCMPHTHKLYTLRYCTNIVYVSHAQSHQYHLLYGNAKS